jgi:hypothetical protein
VEILFHGQSLLHFFICAHLRNLRLNPLSFSAFFALLRCFSGGFAFPHVSAVSFFRQVGLFGCGSAALCGYRQTKTNMLVLIKSVLDWLFAAGEPLFPSAVSEKACATTSQIARRRR